MAVTVIISYDIADDRKRSQIASILQEWGSRIQLSVFLCHLESAALDRLEQRLARMVDPAIDSVHIIPLCLGCQGK